MQIIEYAWIAIEDGVVRSVRPRHPALLELKRGDIILSALANLAVAEWRRSTNDAIPSHGAYEIQIERPTEYYPPKGLIAAVLLEGEPGTFDEQVRRVVQRYEVDGWDFHQVIAATNAGPQLIFTKPEGTPDVQPFPEPNIKV